MSDENFKISLLIGRDHYWDIVEDHIIRGNGPMAMSSKLGYLLSGPLPTEEFANTTISNFHIAVNQDGKEHDLQQFWNLETTGTTPVKEDSAKREFLIEYAKTSVSRQPDGSYCAKLPWKPMHPPLLTNREVCWKRARSLVHRLSQTPALLQTYDKIIAEQVKKGFIEKVPDTSDDNKTHYIPHHCIKKNSTTTPIRIVYDCSCRQSNNLPSLNDCLLTGPHFLNNLCSIILRFRIHNYAASTDIEKAFLHVKLHRDDRDYTRFYWLKDVSNPNGQFDVYRFKAVLFGAVSSPFVLYATLYHHLQQYNTSVSRDILHNLYVGNILSGHSSEEMIIQFYHNARAILSEAHFNLRAWATNSPQLRDITQKEKTADTSTPNNILGMLWNPVSDQLSLTPKCTLTPGNPLTTKRELLQESSKVFDPIGIAVSVTIQAKLLVQKVWSQHIEWDEPLGTELLNEWRRIVVDLSQLPQFSINRKYLPNFSTSDMELHAFSDASNKAYGAVIYLRSQTNFLCHSKVPCGTAEMPNLATVGINGCLSRSKTDKVCDQLHATCQYPCVCVGR